MRYRYPALTLKPEWAHLVAFGRKRVENRTWQTSYRGKIWIHAGLGFARLDHRKMVRQGIVIPPRDVLHRGEIIAVATLHDIVRYSPRANLGKYAFGPFCWILRNVRPVRPRKVSGRLGLWWPE
jgi:hypothetical protein